MLSTNKLVIEVKPFSEKLENIAASGMEMVHIADHAPSIVY